MLILAIQLAETCAKITIDHYLIACEPALVIQLWLNKNSGQV